MTRIFLLAVCAAASLTLPAAAQSSSSTIAGTVRDQSGALVPGAEVSITHVETNRQAAATTNLRGEYISVPLSVGQYRVEAMAQGFKKAVRSGLTLELNQTAVVDLVLEVGETAERVEVVADASQLETTTATMGQVVNNRQIRELPLNTRNVYSLVFLTPGVVGSTSTDSANASNWAVYGTRRQLQDIVIDGVPAAHPTANGFTGVSVFPSVDAIQEFKLMGATFSAEYGRSVGSVLNIVYKSGNNMSHGSVYNFLRNSVLDANGFFANRAGQPLRSFRRNQFGGTLSGPIRKDKTFFMASYEGLRERSFSSSGYSVPTPLQRTGDFSQTLVSNGSLVRIFDPFSTRANPAGGFLRDPFPCNILPANRLDRAGSRIVTFFPAADTAGANCTGINNFLSNKVNSINTNEVDAKVDWAPSVNNKFILGLGWRSRVDTPPNHYGNAADSRNFRGDNFPARSLRLEFNRTQTPTLLMQFRFGITRFERYFDSNAPADFSMTQLGLPAALDQQLTRPFGFPLVTSAGFLGLGKTNQFLDQRGTSYTWTANATRIAGKHQLKSGLEYRINQSLEGVGTDASGSYTFDRTYSQGPNPTAPAVDRGHAIASMLLGTTTSGQAGILPKVLTSNPYSALYFQDDYRVTKKLTLNLGLRWDVEKGRTERFKQLSFFDFDAPSPIAAGAGIANLRGGLRFVGVDGNPERQFNTDWNNFAPRFAFAYSVNPATVVCGGYGFFYLPYIGAAAGWASGINGFLSFTPQTASLDGLRPADPLSNPFPNGLQRPTAPTSGLATNLGQDFGASGRDGAVDRGARVAYSQQWNLNIQRQLPGSIALEGAYVGNKGTKLTDGPLGPQLNQLTPEQLQQGNQLLQLTANAFRPFVRTGPLAQANVTRAQLLRPYPQFLNVYNFRPAAGSSIYHAFQARAEKRYSNGLTLLASFTGGKLIEDTSQTVGFLGSAPTHQNVYDRRASRSLASQDVSRRIVLSYVYDLPFGRGKAFGNRIPKAADAIVGHWQINGILSFSNGVPLAISNAQNNSQSFSAVQRPNVNGRNPSLDGSRPIDEKLPRWFDTSVFSQPAAFTFGNAGRVMPNVRADGVHNWDFSLFKAIPLREKLRLEFRAEFFNFTNTPQFAPPGQAFGNAAFGVVNAQFNAPRQVQFGLKLYY